MYDFTLLISWLFCIFVFFFFFSSRRRHTRCGRDWSSDVCSSDLLRDREKPSRVRTYVRVSQVPVTFSTVPGQRLGGHQKYGRCAGRRGRRGVSGQDRKSTRLNSSHVRISYAVFCLKKKKKNKNKN